MVDLKNNWFVKKQENISHNFLRRKTITNIKQEIVEALKLYEPKFLYFIDDSFLARPRQEIFDFCDMYEEFKIPFWFNTRPENVTPENLKMLKV